MTTSNKSYVGVDNIHYALVTADGSAAYTPGTVKVLAPAMTITQTPKTNTKTQYADNQPFETMSAEGESDVELEITGLPLETYAELLGKVYDAVNGMLYDNGGTPPDVALGFRAEKSDGDHRYYWFLKGNFAPPNEEQSTKTDTPDPKSTKLKFTALRTIHQFALSASVTDSVKRIVADSGDTAFDGEETWFSTVQVPAYTPA